MVTVNEIGVIQVLERQPISARDIIDYQMRKKNAAPSAEPEQTQSTPGEVRADQLSQEEVPQPPKSNDQMKTIKQIAEEIGVSKQAVHKKLKQQPLSTSLQGLITTIGNIVYISVDGEKLVKSAFNRDPPSMPSTPSTAMVDTVDTAVDIVDEMVGGTVDDVDGQVDDITTQLITSLREHIAFLTDQNKDLNEQLKYEREYSREQVGRISDLAASLAQLTDNAQQLTNNAQQLHARGIIPCITNGEPAQATAPISAEPPTKRNIFQRLFRRNK